MRAMNPSPAFALLSRKHAAPARPFQYSVCRTPVSQRLSRRRPTPDAARFAW